MARMKVGRMLSLLATVTAASVTNENPDFIKYSVPRGDDMTWMMEPEQMLRSEAQLEKYESILEHGCFYCGTTAAADTEKCVDICTDFEQVYS